MGAIYLITGGCRSGKSQYAKEVALATGAKRAFIATATGTDDEMRMRIERHKQDRERDSWTTVEEPLKLAEAICLCDGFDAVVVDCLTIWVANIMHDCYLKNTDLDEDDIVEHCARLVSSAKKINAAVIFVTNEIGYGIAPENSVARRFRDLAGRCNQIIAQNADEVVMLVAGLPLKLKRNN